ncbi:MAG: DUF6622 family protein [Burkholderiales bacterium]
MLMQILSGTPKWVFVLFVALLWLGMQQMLPRRVGLSRATIAPLALTCLSLYGVTSAFGESPLAILGWLGGAAVAFAASIQLLSSTAIQYDATHRRFQLPGSMVPLALFMGIFFTKYAVGVSLSMQPALARDVNFALTISTLYGVFSGALLARTARLWRIAMQQANALQAA